MNPDAQREAALFQAAAQLTGNARASFLDNACQGSPGLRQRLEALLAAHEESNGALAEPAPAAKATMKLEFSKDQPDEAIGWKIGRYKILEKVGEGGCGVVYVAEQTEPVRRRVALKVIKLGMDTKQVVARFEAERQALALMDHPNIAKVLDAGTTDMGRPFFVMELVRGIKITDYCDQEKTSTKERLDLFIKVCHAIQHAHQKGIIHRDIKPSNILVTLHDGVPVPKVIDFGIAKATEGRLTDATVYTQLHQFIGTPAYMSPEQAEMSGLDIDTRSDIYSLGVLLYELLVGKTPFDAQELMSQGIDAMRKTIREQEPVRPSTKLGTLQGDELTTTAKRRSVETAKLANLLRGDLDWVVMKCLEKDRTRRYDTANGLAADLKRHLSNEPVVARPPSATYRFQKSLKRNKLAFGTATSVALALVIGFAVSTWMFFQAQAEKKKAQLAASRSEQTTQFLKDMLNGAGPLVAQGRDTTLLREILEKTAVRIGKDLQNAPEVEAELWDTIGEVYVALGEWRKAEEAYKAALDLRRRFPGNANGSIADTLHKLGWVFIRQWKLDEAARAQRESLTICTNLPGSDAVKIAASFQALGVIELCQERFVEAENLFKQSLLLRRKLLGSETKEVAESLGSLSLVYSHQGRSDEAETAARETFTILKKLPNTGADLDLMLNQFHLALALYNAHKLNEAEKAMSLVVNGRKQWLGSEHYLVAQAQDSLAMILAAKGALDEAERLGREALAKYRRLHAEATADFAHCLNGLGVVMRKKNNLADAENLFREALIVRRKLLGNDHPATVESARILNDVLRQAGKPSDVQGLIQDEPPTTQESRGSSH